MLTHRTAMRAFLLGGICGAAGSFAACVGHIGDDGFSGTPGAGISGGPGSGASSGTGTPGGSSSTGTSGGSTSVDGFPCTTSTPSIASTPMLLLTRAQYVNTMRDLFGSVTPSLDGALGSDSGYQVADGQDAQFGLIQANIGLTGITNYQTAAELVARAVASNSATLAKLVPCSNGTDARTCAQNFVQSFGSLAYRAPLTDPADIARHMALYDAGATTSNAHGIELVLRGMLQSPRFLYRVEVGTGAASPTALNLSGYEMAARLSYLLWNTMPDTTLTQAAASGSLTTAAQATAQMTRMLQEPRGQGLVRKFLEAMIELSGLPSAVKEPGIYPQWAGTLPASMQGQAGAFFDDVLNRQGGTISALLTSGTVFFNSDLAAYYGATATGSTFQSLTVPPGKASGLLTLPALLTLMAKPDQPWPIYRGKFVRELLLCQELPSPPPNVPMPPAIEAGVSVRQRLGEHETNPVCASCHTMMDPIGFGFGNYDGLGRLQTLDGNQPIDVTGDIEGSYKTDIDGPFNGVSELASKLAGSTQVRQCFVRQWFRYAMSRFEQDPDNCSMKSIDGAFQAANSSLNALPQALVQSDAFLYRSAQ